jgi:hypothetical protein
MVSSVAAVAQRPVSVGVATVAAIACPLPVQAPLRWDVLAGRFAAVPAEQPVAVAAAAGTPSRNRAYHDWREVRAMVPVLTGGRTVSRPNPDSRSSRPLADAAPGAAQ